jgi:ankyrin repeat protein
VRGFGHSNFAIPFLRDVADVESALSDASTFNRSVRYFHPRQAFLSLRTLLPGEAFPGRCENDTGLVAEDAMLESNFTRLLIFSITNGFAGLGDIPIASILKFFRRYGNIDALFVQVLKAAPNHVAKSFAENLFRVAIEAQESGLIRHLLDTQLLHINEIVCEAGGQKLTALERAAQLRDSKTIAVLLATRADVNKTFASQAMEGGPLKRLLDGIVLGETIGSNVMNVIKVLLKHGANVHASMLKAVIKHTRHSALASCLISHFLRTYDTDLISHGMLSMVTLELDEEHARSSTEQILESCHRLHKNRCMQEFEQQVHWALVQSAKRGHLHVVQLLLRHSRRLPSILSASLRSRNREVIEAVLDKDPNFNAPAHNIDNEIESFSYRLSTRNLTTPLAEAIRTGVNEWVHICEKAGTLGYLRLPGHFEAALAAAAETGNLPYVHKLLQHRPQPPPLEMYRALLVSVQNGHEDMSMVLINAGAEVDIESNLTSSSQTPLFAAVLKRNARVVRAILNLGDVYIRMHTSTIFLEAIKWGDRSIISDLHLAFPTERLSSYDRFDEILSSMNEDMLMFLMDHDLVDARFLTRCLADPIKKGNIAMINRLIELGADPSDSGNLALAVSNLQPDVLKLLLEYCPRLTAKIVPGFGTDAIKAAIKLSLAGLPMLDMLISIGSVDVRSFGDFMSGQSPLGLAIMKAEIYKGDFPIVRLLLDAGCKANSVVYQKRRASPLTALLAGITIKSIDMVKLLINYGAEVNTEATRRLTRTPLQLAAELGCLQIVDLLLKQGAKVNALPAQRGGGTALQLAAISGDCNIVAALLDKGADISALPSPIHGRWPLEGAAEHGRLDMIDYLMKVSIYDHEQCKRAMKMAEDNGHLGCRDLIQNHISLNESLQLLPANSMDGQNDWMEWGLAVD